jgi:hypothetical protein
MSPLILKRLKRQRDHIKPLGTCIPKYMTPQAAHKFRLVDIRVPSFQLRIHRLWPITSLAGNHNVLVLVPQ